MQKADLGYFGLKYIRTQCDKFGHFWDILKSKIWPNIWIEKWKSKLLNFFRWFDFLYWSKTWPLEKISAWKILMIRRVYKVVPGYFVGSVILYWKLYGLCSKYLTKMGTIKQWWYTVCYFSAGQAGTAIHRTQNCSKNQKVKKLKSQKVKKSKSQKINKSINQ